jgi:hypothetical protein
MSKWTLKGSGNGAGFLVVLHIYVHATTYILDLHIRNIQCSAYIVVHLYYYLSIKGYYKFV